MAIKSAGKTGVYVIAAGLFVIPGLIWWLSRKAKAESRWNTGDTLLCFPGNPGPLYISEVKQVNSDWNYHIWEGTPPPLGSLVEDLGWFTEQELTVLPFACNLWQV